MPTLLTSQPLDRSFFERRDATLVAWLGMAGVIINARSTILLIDPLITAVERDGKQFCEAIYPIKVPLPIEARAIPRVDWVLYTHADDDHLGRMTAKTLAGRTRCKFVAPHMVERTLWELEIDEERITTAQDFMTLRAGGAEIYVTPALHDWQEVDPYQRGDCVGYLVKTADGAIWHPGDTRLIDELLEVKDVDVLFFDVFGVDSHLGPEGSARLAASSGAKVMVAYHYGTLELPAMFAGYDPEDAQPYLQDLAAKFLVLNPGEPLELPLKEPSEAEPVVLPEEESDEKTSEAGPVELPLTEPVEPPLTDPDEKTSEAEPVELPLTEPDEKTSEAEPVALPLKEPDEKTSEAEPVEPPLKEPDEESSEAGEGEEDRSS